jgi:hypothetical protein
MPKNEQGAEAPCSKTYNPADSRQNCVPKPAADLSEFGEAELNDDLFGLGDFHFNDLLLHRIPPARFDFV